MGPHPHTPMGPHVTQILDMVDCLGREIELDELTELDAERDRQRHDAAALMNVLDPHSAPGRRTALGKLRVKGRSSGVALLLHRRAQKTLWRRMYKMTETTESSVPSLLRQFCRALDPGSLQALELRGEIDARQLLQLQKASVHSLWRGAMKQPDANELHQKVAVEGRNEIRSHEAVREELSRWWTIAKLMETGSKTKVSIEHKLFSQLRRNSLTKEERLALEPELSRAVYDEILLRVSKALLEPDEKWDEEEAKQAVAEAWLTDAEGCTGFISRSKFVDAIYELADVYANNACHQCAHALHPSTCVPLGQYAPLCSPPMLLRPHRENESMEAREYASFLAELRCVICGGEQGGVSGPVSLADVGRLRPDAQGGRGAGGGGGGAGGGGSSFSGGGMQ